MFFLLNASESPTNVSTSAPKPSPLHSSHSTSDKTNMRIFKPHGRCCASVSDTLILPPGMMLTLCKKKHFPCAKIYTPCRYFCSARRFFRKHGRKSGKACRFCGSASHFCGTPCHFSGIGYHFFACAQPFFHNESAERQIVFRLLFVPLPRK